MKKLKHVRSLLSNYMPEKIQGFKEKGGNLLNLHSEKIQTFFKVLAFTFLYFKK